MRKDGALAVAVGGTIAYTIAVGAMSSKPAAPPVSDGRPVAMFATFAKSGTTLRIAEPAHIDAIAQWLDDAMSNPRSALDLQVMPPSINELDVEFESGERTTIRFSGRVLDDEDGAHRPHPVCIVQHEGASFTIDWVPEVLEGYLELTESPPSVPRYTAKPQR